MIHLEEPLFESFSLFCDIIFQGKDITLSVYGGDTPHIGSVVLSISRPSLTGQGISVTSSVLNAVGHKDETVARWFAETVAVKKECTVVCSCGIHVDNITAQQLLLVKESCSRLLQKIIYAIG
ncbi:MAG: hypothetical protein ACI4C1_07915 [Lachnospiraceae bacterium]